MPALSVFFHRAVEPGLIALALLPGAVDQATTDTSGRAWWVIGAYSVACLAGLAVRRRRPIATFAVILLSLAIAQITAAATQTDLSTLTLLPLALACYGVGAYATNRASVAAMLGGVAVIAFGMAINHVTAPDGWRGGSDVLAAVAPLPIAWALGIVVRSNRELLAAEQRRADDAIQRQRLVVEHATQQERLRIARDMHDVVAHALTLLVVHAETLRSRESELPAWAGGHADAIAAAGRQAVGELGSLLAVLRAGQPSDSALSTDPTPALDDLPALVDIAREAGHSVEVDTAVDLEKLAVPATMQLALYRVAQEALANVRRHAPGAPVSMVLSFSDDNLSLTIRNGPPLGRPLGRGNGWGITGMTERVAAFGGRLTTGSTIDGGFQVAATLPLPS